MFSGMTEKDLKCFFQTETLTESFFPIASNLNGCDLSGCDLSGSILFEANLAESNLSGANLSHTSLQRANLLRANLSGANLTKANLTETNFHEAYLSGTCLDPEKNTPETDLSAFEKMDDYLIGYRTNNSAIIDPSNLYKVGEKYKSPYFSVCTKTECHPGLYIFPTLQQAEELGGKIIRVRALIKDTLKAGNKYRTKEFVVTKLYR
jgi:uncharacterized protein YjbI with pentapeptide repeats